MILILWVLACVCLQGVLRPHLLGKILGDLRWVGMGWVFSGVEGILWYILERENFPTPGIRFGLRIVFLGAIGEALEEERVSCIILLYRVVS